MSKYAFSPAQRAAVWVTHGEKCYMCNRLVDLQTVEVDHVIPEWLEKDQEQLSAALRKLGRPPGFSLNSYENWLPICRPCNRTKGDLVPDDSLLIQTHLQRAANKADSARQHEKQQLSARKISVAVSDLLKAEEAGGITNDLRRQLLPLVEPILPARQPERAGKPLRLTPTYDVISEGGMLKVVRGPYGTGMRPVGPHVDPSWDCPNCGTAAGWNGARCVICGQLNDE